MITRLERVFISTVAAVAVLSFPLANKIMFILGDGESKLPLASYVTGWVFVGIMLLFLILSVWIASRRQSRHWLECFLDGAGIPGFLISMLVGVHGLS